MATIAIRQGERQVTALDADDIFVFGSNLAGRHGKGAAKYAMQKFHAEYGVGRGLTGQCYALPTLTGSLGHRSLADVREEYRLFGEFASTKPELTFYLTACGSGLAGQDVADMRQAAEDYCDYPNVIPWWHF